MTRKGMLLCLLALLLLTGCLFASCGMDVREESTIGSSEAFPPAETSEPSSEEGSSEEQSSDPSTEPDAPEETIYYLPTEGVLRHLSTDTDARDTRYTFTYGEDSVEIVWQDGYDDIELRYEYRVDEDGRVTAMVLTVTTDVDVYTETHGYTYDGEGRMTGCTTHRSDGGVEDSTEYLYDEAGRLLRWKTEAVYANGFTAFESIDYLRSFDESGLLTRMEEQASDGSSVVHLYEDGREVLRNAYEWNGSPAGVTAFSYDESGRLAQERYRRGDYLYADTYFYNGDRLTEVLRDEGKGSRTSRIYTYDRRGRVTDAGWHDDFYSLFYGENGTLCRVESFRITEEEERQSAATYEITAWGEEAATERQLALYRIAMAMFLRDVRAGVEQFYTVAYPEP